jgi:Transmembrane domain of unknown function (DUF3566)
MTETTAKSGGSGTSTTPVDGEPNKDGSPPAGREAAGRAAVPADAPSQPKFTRAPGMAPPPGDLQGDGDAPSEPKRQGPPAVAKGSATVPVVTKGSGAAPGSQSGRVSVSPPVKPGAAPQRPGTGPGRPGAPTPPQGPGGQGPGSQGAGSRGAGKGPAGAAAVGAARVSEAVRSARSTVTSAAARGPRRARLNLKRIDPWSVMKFSFAVSVVLFIVVVVATSVLYLALDAMGVWGEINNSLKELVSASGGADQATSSPFRITAWGVIGTSMLIGAVNVVLFTALATLGAFIYNVCADLVGGVELTLAERD